MGDRSRARGARAWAWEVYRGPRHLAPPRARDTLLEFARQVCRCPAAMRTKNCQKRLHPPPPACGVRSAPVRVSRGAHADRAAPMGVPSARAGGERANAPLSCRHLVTAPAWGGRTAQKVGFPPHGQTASAHWSCEFEERSAAAGGLRCRDPPHTSRARAAFRACAITPPETPVCPSRLS